MPAPTPCAFHRAGNQRNLEMPRRQSARDPPSTAPAPKHGLETRVDPRIKVPREWGAEETAPKIVPEAAATTAASSRCPVGQRTGPGGLENHRSRRAAKADTVAIAAALSRGSRETEKLPGIRLPGLNAASLHGIKQQERKKETFHPHPALPA